MKKICTILFGILIISRFSSYAKADTLDFDNILKKAVANSYDLKLANIDVKISQASVKEAKSDYFPTLKTGVNYEYNKDMQSDQSLVTSIGGTVVNQNTMFQDVASVSLNYNLFDFGVRSNKVLIAKKDVEAKKYTYNQVLRNLKLNTLQAYTQALLYYKEMRLKEDLLPVYKDMFAMKERMYEAGSVSKLDVMDEALDIARTIDSIDNLNKELKASIKDIESLTMESYESKNIKLDDFDASDIVPVSNVTVLKPRIEKNVLFDSDLDLKNTPESKIFQAQIEGKKAELEVYKRQRYPQISFYTNYSFYGNAGTNPYTAIKDIESDNWLLGISANLMLFDGFKNQGSRQRLQNEVEKLQVQKEQKIHEISIKYKKSQEQAKLFEIELKDKQELLSDVDNKLTAIKKLTENQVTDKTTYLKQKAELLNQKIELEKSIINSVSTVKQLEIISTEYK